jgi:uncharacterized membrane protein
VTPFLAAIAAAIVVGTAALTALRYPALPDRVPIHFGFDGRADRYGPRPAAWIAVGAQLVVAMLYAALYIAGAARQALVGGVVLLAFFGWMQKEILEAATSGTNRIPPSRMWAAIVILIAVTIFVRFAR